MSLASACYTTNALRLTVSTLNRQVASGSEVLSPVEREGFNQLSLASHLPQSSQKLPCRCLRLHLAIQDVLK